LGALPQQITKITYHVVISEKMFDDLAIQKDWIKKGRRRSVMVRALVLAE
jgi:hypothetical protein